MRHLIAALLCAVPRRVRRMPGERRLAWRRQAASPARRRRCRLRGHLADRRPVAWLRMGRGRQPGKGRSTPQGKATLAAGPGRRRRRRRHRYLHRRPDRHSRAGAGRWWPTRLPSEDPMPEQEETIPGQLAEIRSRLDKGRPTLRSSRRSWRRTPRSPGHSRRADGRARCHQCRQVARRLGAGHLRHLGCLAPGEQRRAAADPAHQVGALHGQATAAGQHRTPAFQLSTYVAMAICYAFDWWMDPGQRRRPPGAHPAVPFLLKLSAPISFAMGALACVAADDCAGTGASTGPGSGHHRLAHAARRAGCRCVCRWRRPSRS